MKKRNVKSIVTVVMILILVLLSVGCGQKKSAVGFGKDYKLSIGDDEAKEYILSFDVNGGNSLFDIVVPEGTSVVLPGSTRTGYEFVCWTAADGTEYKEGDSILLDDDMTLTAEWKQVDTPVKYGDVNGDTYVNTIDRMMLARHVAKWPEYPASSIDMAAADVNQDGNVNTLDRMILSRYIAQWPGYLELPYTD